jgi:hypothetical protein
MSIDNIAIAAGVAVALVGLVSYVAGYRHGFNAAISAILRGSAE